MKQSILFFLFFTVLLSIQAQTIVDPQTFTSDTTISDTDETYGRPSSTNKKFLMKYIRKYVRQGFSGDITVNEINGVVTLSNGVVTNVKLGANAVDSTKAANLSPNDLAQTGATSGQVLTWTGSKYAPRDASGGSGGITALTGDVTASGTGSVAATIANNAVTSAKIASQAVDSLDIKNRSITTVKISDDAVTSAKIASQVIDSADLKNRGTTLLKLAQSGATNGQVPKYNSTTGNWEPAADAGGSGSPGGSTTQIQYNNAGAFAGSASLTLVGDTTKMDKAKIPSTGAIFAGDTKVAHFFTPSGGVVSNVFLGGSGNTTMTSVGELAGSIFSGCHNSVVGYNALKNNVYGYLNQVVGFESMMYADSAAGSCVLGGRALQYARGHDNIAIGDGSLQYTFYGDENVSVGYRSGNNNKSGRRNVNIGTTSNFYGSNLSYCTFLGYDTGVAIGDSLDGFENSTAVGQGAKISESNHMVLGNNSLLKVETAATIHANRVGSNFRMKGGGTDDTDGGFYVGSGGNITLANWSGNKGLSIFNSDGRIEQLGTGSFKVNNLGINTAASGTHKLNVSGTSAFSGTLNANQTGANFRAQGTGTGAGDAAILASGGNIWFSNWDANLGIKILSSGIVHTLGNGKFGAGGVTAPTAMIHAAASTTSAASYRVPSGTAPTSPNEGDLWNNGTDLKYYTGTTTYDLARVLKGSATLDFPNTTTGNSSDLTITVTGAADGDIVLPPGVPHALRNVAGTDYRAWVSSANTVTIRFINTSGADIDPASNTFKVTVTK